MRIAVTNQKGGAGKTTTAVSLAAALAGMGHRCLLIDLDPQASASRWLGVEGGREFLDVLGEDGKVADLVKPTGVKNLDLVPSSLYLGQVERTLATEPGAEKILGQCMQGLRGWSYIFIDLPPAVGLLSFMGLTAADCALVACESSADGVAGLAAVTSTLAKVRERCNPKLSLLGVLQCRANMQTRLARQVREHLQATFNGKTFNTVIRQDVRMTECLGAGEPIGHYAPGCNSAIDYEALATEILGSTGHA